MFKQLVIRWTEVVVTLQGVATKIKVISALRKSLLNSSEKFVGGPAVDGDRQLLACRKQLRDADPHKKISSEREEFSVKYRLGQKVKFISGAGA